MKAIPSEHRSYHSLIDSHLFQDNPHQLAQISLFLCLDEKYISVR